MSSFLTIQNNITPILINSFRMKKNIILCLTLLIQIGAMAQPKFNLKSADKFFDKADYYNAIVNYEIYLGIRKPVVAFTPYGQKKNFAIAKTDSAAVADNIIATSPLVTDQIANNMAESYLNQNHYLRAEKCYARLLQSPKPNLPLARYWYGVCLRSNNKFEEAAAQFNTFIAENKTDKARVDIGKKELATLAYIKSQLANEAQKQFSVKKLRGNIAQSEGAYAPVFIKDTLVFTSARIVDSVNKYSRTNMHVNHLFANTIAANDSISGKAMMLRFPSKLSINEATAAFTPDNSKLFFSRSTTVDDKLSIAIYVSKKGSDGNWGEPIKLDDKVNKAGFNAIQPSVSQDGKYLLFASNRDGGVGGYDIWAAPLDNNGTVGESFNLKTINTKADEEAPFYHVASKSLVFASKGYDGMGGFDIYAASGDITALQAPSNLGFPANSPKDDIYFFSTSSDSLLKKAYISSDRASDCCLEIFALNKTYTLKQYKHSIVGSVKDCTTGTSIANAAIEVFKNKKHNSNISTDVNGNFEIEIAKAVTNLAVAKEGYIAVNKDVPIYRKPLTQDVVDTINICLNAKPIEIPKNVEQVKDSINISEKPLIVYFDFDKSVVKKEGVTVLNEVVSILKKYPTISLSLDINGYTDAKGTDEYNLKLGEARAEACKAYIVSQGIDAGRMLLKSFGKATPVAPNTAANNADNPEGRALNRRVEIKINATTKK